MSPHAAGRSPEMTSHSLPQPPAPAPSPPLCPTALSHFFLPPPQIKQQQNNNNKSRAYDFTWKE
eukprot:473368-Rhodomonas_salina.1